MALAFLRRREAPLLLALAAFAGACVDSKTGQSDADVPRWRGTSDLVIAGPDSTAATFRTITGIAADNGGRIVIVDGEQEIVSAYDSAGRFLYTIGSAGTGPGQFRRPCCLAFGPDGSLWLRDIGNSRYLNFSLGATGATLVGTRQGASTFGQLAHRLTFDSAGRLIDIVIRPTPQGQTLMLRFHVDSAGQPHATDTIPAPPSDSLGIFQVAMSNNSFGFVSQPYGPRLLVAHGPGGNWARAISSRYLVRWSRGGGEPATVRRDMIGPALSTRERLEADSVLRNQAEQVGQSASTLPFGVPGSKTPVTGLMFDEEGSLWVQLSVGDGELNRADVWREPGRRVGNAEWPAGIDLSVGYIGAGAAFGVSRDSAGAPRVTRVRFSR